MISFKDNHLTRDIPVLGGFLHKRDTENTHLFQSLKSDNSWILGMAKTTSTVIPWKKNIIFEKAKALFKPVKFIQFRTVPRATHKYLFLDKQLYNYNKCVKKILGAIFPLFPRPAYQIPDIQKAPNYKSKQTINTY